MGDDRPVVVVTGASGGVGRAVARAYGRRGAAVGLIARGEAGLHSAASDVEHAGGTSLALQADVAHWPDVSRAATMVEHELGPIDVWINAAFATVFATFDTIEPDEFRRVTEVTYLGYVNGTRAALQRMRPRQAGTIVQVGSALAYRGIPLQSAYCGAKHAIRGFTEGLRCELMHEGVGVDVTSVHLPAVNTPQFSWVRSRLSRRPRPVAPIYPPEVAARAIVHAADHPKRRGYWVGTSTALTIWGNAVAPGLLDRYLARTGFDAQQTDEATPGGTPGNLWIPVDENRDFGAHGRFPDDGMNRDPQLWASRHHGALAALGAGLMLVGRRVRSRR